MLVSSELGINLNGPVLRFFHKIGARVREVNICRAFTDRRDKGRTTNRRKQREAVLYLKRTFKAFCAFH